MKIGDLNIEGNLFSAPLAGISDSVFRTFCRNFGASATVSEMVSAKGLSYSDRKTERYLYFTEAERPIGIQLFASDAQSVLNGLVKVIDANPDFIDFNMGCPVKKVVKQGAGGALLNNPIKAAAILKSLVKASPVPVTAKMRSGWDSSSIIFPELARRLQDAGVAAIFIHPRTVIQGFSGKADRGIARNAARKLSIPIIYSGDIDSPEDAKSAMEETESAGIMVGRASMGDPYIFKRIKRYFETGELIPELSPTEKIDLLLEYYQRMIEFYNTEKGSRMMRKFIVWHTRGLPGKSQLRQDCFGLDSYEEVIKRLHEYKEFLIGTLGK